MKWAGKPDMLFSLLLEEQEEEGHEVNIKPSVTVKTVGIKSYLTLILIRKLHLKQLWLTQSKDTLTF